MPLSKKSKVGITMGIVSGSVFATLMALFEYYQDKPFHSFKFIFHFVCFGLFQGLIFGPFSKNKSERKEDS